MSRPIAFPTWATNVTYAGGPDVGTPTKIAPSGGREADGWRNQDVPPAQEQNYEQGLISEWLEWIDNGWSSFSGLAAVTGVVDGTKIFAAENGWYQYNAADVYSPDGVWVIDATAMGAGQWIHELLAFEAYKIIPAIGPTPADTYTAGTVAGRLNRQIIDHGYFRHRIVVPQTEVNTSTSLTTMVTYDLGDLAVGDIIRAQIPAVATCAVAFDVGTFLSANAGASYFRVSPDFGVLLYDPTTTGAHTRALALDFTYVALVGANHRVQVQTRTTSSGGGNSLGVYLGNGIIEVIRP